jgi:hypothetical protein
MARENDGVRLEIIREVLRNRPTHNGNRCIMLLAATNCFPVELAEWLPLVCSSWVTIRTTTRDAVTVIQETEHCQRWQPETPSGWE